MSSTADSSVQLLPTRNVPHLSNKVSGFQSANVRVQTLRIWAHSLSTLLQTGRQASLAPSADVSCVKGTRIPYSNAVLSNYFLYTSVDELAQSVRHRDVKIVSSEKAGAALVNWIPVNCRLCAVSSASGRKVVLTSVCHQGIWPNKLQCWHARGVCVSYSCDGGRW